MKHSPEGRYELSSIEKAAVSMMNGVEERPQLFTVTRRSGNRKVRKTLLGVTLLILALSASMSAFFCVTSQDLTKRIQATTGQTVMEFNSNLNYATIVLGSEATPENINDLIRYFNFYVQSV